MTLAAGYGGTVTLSTNVTVTGDLTASSGTLVAPAGGTVVTVLGRLVRTAPGALQWSTGRLRLGGDLVLNASDTTAVASSTVEFNGSLYQVVSGTGSGLLPTLDVNSSSKVYFNRQGGGVSVTGGVRLRAGTLDLGGQLMFDSNGHWVQTGGQFVAAQSTVIFWGGSSASPLTVTALPANPFFNLRIGALPQALFPGHLQAAGSLDVDGSVIISSGSFDPGAFAHTVGGDWQQLGGDFVGSTGTIRLDGAAVSKVIQLPGARFSALDVVKAATTTFPFGLTVSSLSFAQSGGTLNFQTGSTVTVSRLLLGAPGLAQRVRLRSTTAGVPWNLIVTGTATVARTDVAASNASAGLAVEAAAGDNLDSGLNVNWVFSPVLSAGPFSAVSSASLTASWASTFPGGTVFYAEISTSASFAPLAASSNTVAASALFSGLTAQTTYHARVATTPAGPFISLGSTIPLRFVRQQLPGTAGYALRIGLGDLDGDGDLDAALAQATTLNETVLRNDGGGAFTQVTIAGSGGASSSLALCDLDADGDLDLLVGNDANEDEVLYRNDGALAFTKMTLTGTGGNTKGVACADHDADGDQDAVVANDLGQSMVLLKNNGGLSFTQTTLPGTGANNRDVKWLDYDSDGDLDVFVGVNGDDGVLRNDGDAGFTKVNLAGSGGDTVRVSLADHDLDGDLDPILANFAGGRMLLNRSDGAGGFSALPLMSSTGTYDVAWGDYDGDGDADALFGEVYGDDYIARNDGAGVFTRVELTGSKGNTNSVAWGDFDADGDLDALLGKALTANAVLMVNQGSAVNAPPTAPGGVALTFAGHPSSAALTLTWSAAAYDGGLSTAGLSYALVVATAPMTLSGDSMRIVSPSRFVVTWNHGTPPGGNAQKARYRLWPGEATARNGLAHALDVGGVLGANFQSDATYYFRLQTVDAGFARSTWSAEASTFVLRAAPPAAALVLSSTALSVSYATSGAAGYLLRASTAADLSGTVLSASASSATAALALSGLTPSTTYYLRFGALWQRTTVWAETVPASAQTAAVPAVLSTGPFSSVSTASLTASWGSTFPGGTLHYAQISTSPSFTPLAASSVTLGSSARFDGLNAGTRYHARVATSAAGPFAALGSTRTAFELPAGCATALFVLQNGEGDCTRIQACVDLVPSTPLTGDACVAVLDAGVYSERVTVSGKAPNGFRIRLWGAGPARPSVNPPAGSSAGVRLANSSVTLSDINVVTTNTVNYGVWVSSPFVSVSSLGVDSGGRINGAGVFLSSQTTLSYASVTVQNAEGVLVSGSSNTVAFTTASVTAFSRAAFTLSGAWGNSVTDSTGTGNPGYGAFLIRSHGNTLARNALRKVSATAGAAGLYLNNASSNVVTAGFISNAGGTGADLASFADYNLIELSTVTAAGSVYTALQLGHGRGNRVSRVYAHSAAGNASTLSSGISESLVENSTFFALAAGAAALSTNGSSDTLTGNMLYAPNGIALALNGSSITVARTAGYTATSSYSAFYVGSGGLVTVRDSSFENAAGDGGRVERASYVDILRSTLTAAGGGAALKLQGASSNTVTASRLAAPGGVGLAVGSYLELFDMTTTTGSGNAFSGLTVSASTAVSLGAAPGLELSSCVLTGDAQGAAVAFGDAVLVATFTGLAFPSGAAWSAEAALLPAGSRITIRDASGPQGGSLYENDRLSLVDWVPDLVPFVLPSAPAAPSGTVLGTSSIAWTWAAVANAQSYRVYSSSSGSLLATSASTGVVITDLLPATTNSVAVAGVARGENGPLSPSATAHTHASAPAGLTLDFLFVSSAALSWSLEDNPWETLAELQRSTDGASYAVRAGTLAPNIVDSGLLGCTSYYYRVRHKSPAGVGSPFDGPLLVRTAASTPSAPGDLSAQSLPGRRVSLTWTGSGTEGVLEYRLYKDTGAGSVDYSAPYAVFGPAVRSTTTVALSTGAIHLFGLRAFHRCGLEERNTHAVASAWALETLDGVRASIKVPATGKKISGNRVLVMAELDTGSSTDVSSVLFQYRSTGSATWTDVPAANINHPNPDREQPFFVHWDVSALADRAYDLRAVASDVVGASDPAPGAITVLVDSVSFEVKETDLGGGKVKKEQAVSNETSNTVATAESGSAVVTKVILPAGALNTSDATLSATANPAALPPPPAAATSLGASIEITLSNGQSQLSNGQTAAIVFNYPDDNGDGVIDGTLVRAENAEIQTFDVPTNKWKKEFATTVDRDKKTLTGFTPHFSLFAAFGVVSAGLDQIRVYPNPYKPNAGNPDEGRTFSRSDPLSGVVFDNLPAVVDIKIYTLTGRLVSSFGTTAGGGAVQWDGKNDNGEDVASGGYFAVITSPGQKTVIKKLAVIR